MKNKIILFSLIAIMNAIDIMAQLPSQTVVFKVRKAQREEIQISQTLDYEPPFITVEENATFQGGDVNTFRSWIQSEIIYPPDAAEAGISGKVFVQFCVNSKGKVCDIIVLRSVHPEIDKEVVRCINNSPDWIPAKQGGKAVTQQFVMPVIFTLQNYEK
jgi:periplasmic protein TonB